MPRSATKSQADKQRHRSSIQASPPPMQDLEVEDIIPGRLTQTQWMDMLIQEDTDEIVGEIMEELLSKVMEGCLKVHIKRQLATFSALWAKSYLTQILEQQFICLVEGEEPDEASKTEDTEPTPSISDAWAQGCVPVVNATTQIFPVPGAESYLNEDEGPEEASKTEDSEPELENSDDWALGCVSNATPQLHPASQQEVYTDQVPVHTEPRVNQQFKTVAQANTFPKQSEASPRRPVTDMRYKVFSPRVSAKDDGKKKQQINLPSKPVPSKLLPPLPRSAEKKDLAVEGKNRTHSISNSRTGSLFRPKVDQPIPKLDPSCLPRHCIFPQYEILDKNFTKANTKKSKGQLKLGPIHTKPQTEWTATPLKPRTSSKHQPQQLQRRNETDALLKKVSPSTPGKEGMVIPGPLRLDTMELAKGVSLLDPQKVDITSFKFNPPALPTKFSLIRSEAPVPLFSVEQVTTGPPPQVTPLFQSKS